uniref:Uncharacterized protein n=1 Tax=Globisporangium ultimum (strain ATCC 200006 / CBS 805.95 / DAOM BR144) TaxID=431595 RepID=K3WUS2_GLOUD
MAGGDVICISDDEQDDVVNSPSTTATPTTKPATKLYDDGYDTDDIKTEDDETAIADKRSSLLDTPSSAIGSSSKKKKRTGRDSVGFTTPERTRKRRTSMASGNRRESGIGLKPLTPSTTVNSSMNASLVFDMVTSLSTNDPGAAIATLRSIVVLGKEYPSNLLYDELIDRIQSVEAVAYADAVSIYSSLVFVFDKASACSCAVSYPPQWEPLASALQDASVKPVDETWRRNLLVIQFYVYCLKQDMFACRQRYVDIEKDTWMFRTRLFALLQSDTSGRKSKTKIRDNLILQAIGCGMQLWKRVFDSDDGDKSTQFRHEGEDTCLAVLRLIEMLYLCSNQVQNILQRLQAGIVEMSRETRIKFSQAIQSPDLKVRVATTVMGLTNKSRSTEFEWYESNAMGRVIQAISGETSDDLMMTDGYSWSHFDSFMTAPPQNDFGRLLQEIARLQQDQ